MADFSLTASIRKAHADGDRVYMYGWAALSTDSIGEPVIDADNDYIPAAELEKAAQAAFLDRGGKGAVGQMHDVFGKADLVESFVLTAEKQAAFGLTDAPQGWMVGLTSTDPDVCKAVRSGAMLELSIRGHGRREPVDVPAGMRPGDVVKKRAQVTHAAGHSFTVVRDLQLSDVELLSIVDKGASGNDRVRPRIVLVKRKGKPMSDTVFKRSAHAILAELFESGKLAELPPEEKEALLMLASGMTPPMPAPEPDPEPEPVVAAEDADEDVKADDDEMPKADDDEDMSKRDELAKANVELTKRVAELEAMAKRAELIELVKADMAYLPGASVEDIAKVLHETRTNLGSDVAAQVETLLKAASAAVQKGGLLDAAGVRSAANDNDAGANELQSLAKSLRDKNPKLSAAEAIVEAGRARPDLWAEHRKGR